MAAAATTDAATTVSAGAVIGICNPLLDISANVPATLLTKYGLKPSDAILAGEEHLPLYGELEKEFPVEYIAGGSGQNSMRAVTWMLQTPGAAGFLGCVGADKHAEQLRTAAAADGLTVHYMVDEATPTGTCAVLVNDKDRSLVARLAAAEKYNKAKHLDTPAVTSVVDAARMVYATGFFVTVSIETLQALANHCAANNKPYMMNVSAPFIVQVPIFWERFSALLPFVDVLFGNEHEIEALGTALALAEPANLEAVALHVADKLPKKNEARKRVVVVTQGARQTLVATDGTVQTFHPLKLSKEQIVDTNGAGDSFVGGFLSRFALGRSLPECVAAGHYCASVCIQTSGCKFPGKPTFDFQQ